MTGSQSIEGGYADRIVSVRCDDSLSGFEQKTAQNFLGMEVSYSMDKCPLNIAPVDAKVMVQVAYKNGQTGPLKMPADEFVSQNGGFGVTCLYDSEHKICSVDPTVTYSDIKKVLTVFVDQTVNKKDHVVEMRF